MTRMHEDARTVIVKGMVEFFARVIIDPVTEQAQIEDVYTDESPDWHSGSLIDEDGDNVTDPTIERMVDAWAFDRPVSIEFEWSPRASDLSEHGPFNEGDDEDEDEDPLDPDERDRVEALKLASERNPDIAWTQADLDDH